ncbi:MAG TPA: hypothetical protein VK669_09555 [Candidatus Limnocylindrales bacterium]|nr:hypothetical protein [Candidatus Limnocylindrales bacterium]
MLADRMRVAIPGGLVRDGARRAEAELRALSGHEEERLAFSRGTPLPARVSELLGACASFGEDVRELIAGDRDYLMLELRRMTLGERYLLVVRCPSGGHVFDVEFAADDVTITRNALHAQTHAAEIGGRTMTFRLPTGADQEAVARLPLPAAVDALFERCAISPAASALDPAERELLAAAMERVAPQAALDLDLTCPECGAAFEEPFDPAAFFFRELRDAGHDLLRDVHELARAYHWNEAEILALSRPRRLAYLQLVHDARGASA